MRLTIVLSGANMFKVHAVKKLVCKYAQTKASEFNIQIKINRK